MQNRDFIDLGRILDRVFEAAENFGEVFEPGFAHQFKTSGTHKDFYSIYPFPPVNIYLVADRTMVFEFALSGYPEENVSLEFQGDYMVLTAEPPENIQDEDDVIYFNRRLKFSRVAGQKYYVPADKFDRDNAKAVFRNGILKVTVPPYEEAQDQPGVKIRIVSGEEEDET